MIGIIGCGAMGSGMIENLVAKNHPVLGFDLSEDCRNKVKELGAQVTQSTDEICANCDLIILSLPKAEIVRSVVEQLAPNLNAGTIILDASTSEPDTTQQIAKQLLELGCYFLDAPLSGGPKGARAGTMTMLLGGDAKCIDRIKPILEDMTGTMLHVGPSGSAHAAKIANNLLCAANLVLVSEMAHLAEKVDVDLETLLAGVNAGSGRSGVSEVNFPTWITNQAYDSGFTMGLMRKDVGLATKLAEQYNMELPATKAIYDVWQESRELLDDSADFNEIYKYGK